MKRLSFPLVASFYTKNTPYEEEVRHLRDSCERFHLEHHIVGVPSMGSWELNCAYKPLFLLQMMEKLRRPLLWVDADAVFVREPSFLEVFRADLAVRMYNCPDHHPSRIVSATLFINATPAALQILHLWAEECISRFQEKDRKQEVWDQDALRKVLLEEEHGATYLPLPAAYSKIPEHPEDEAICQDPVIVQNQASRRYKRWVNCPEERQSFDIFFSQ
ncbi:MAG: glycosyltransferase family 77 protein [Chlamydiae bacterium]|nr:glycosyltransferase family 77 protein [Chlamydiota bacterium]